MGHGLFSVSQSTKHSSRMWTGWRAAAIRSTGTLTSNTIRRHVSTGGPVRDYAAAVQAINSVQSNFTTVEKVRILRQQGKSFPITEMIKLFETIGYEPSQFDTLNPIHIAGTKGKGSTAAFVSSILSCHADLLSSRDGEPSRIGLYTSPHLRTVRERIKIDNQPMSKADFTKYTFEVWDRFEKLSADAHSNFLETNLNYFRCLTLIAYHAYMRMGVHTAVIECGIGGEEDTTNVFVKPSVTAVTSLGLDHQPMLGDTIESIAWHKSGILKSGVPALTVTQPPGALQVLRRRAVEKGTELQVIGMHPAIADIKLGMAGEIQKLNASLAVAIAASHLGRMGCKDLPGMSDTSLPHRFRQGLENAQLGGRFDQRADVQGDICWYLDGGHTLESIELTGKWYASSSDPRAPVDDNSPRILIFNQQTRDASALARHLHSTLAAATQAHHPFTHAIFCTNTTYEKTGFSSELISMNTNAADVQSLSVQHALAKSWADIDLQAQVNVVRTIQEAIELARDISRKASTNADGVVKVLATGSMHLVGGIIEVLEAESEDSLITR